MYKGAIVEELDAFHLADAKHPYTKVLLSSIFEIGQDHKPLTLDEAALEAQRACFKTFKSKALKRRVLEQTGKLKIAVSFKTNCYFLCMVKI